LVPTLQNFFFLRYWWFGQICLCLSLASLFRPKIFRVRPGA
jgi:hypothetical protein